jgi:GntR family transcriptional regulator, rspAB operon transcriptional repressor
LSIRVHPESTRQTPKQGEVERVYQLLLEWLMDAVLPPGEFLSEPDLAQRCRTSRTPVREACMRLLQDKWLSRFPQKGFLVTPISVRDIVDLYQFRKLLECFTVERVARSASPDQLARLRAMLALEKDPGADTTAMVLANEAFHLRLAALAGNERVQHQLGLTLAFARRLDTLYLRVDRTWIAHEDLLAALEQQDGAAARTAMAAHLDHAQDCLVKLFDQSTHPTL